MRSSRVTERSGKRGDVARKQASLKRDWTAFIKARPGRRFEESFHRHRDVSHPAWQRFLAPALGLVIVVLGLILMPAPGPGIPVVMVGLALMARSFLWVAKLLDRCEPPLRAWLSGVSRWWKSRWVSTRIALCAIAGVTVLAGGTWLFVVLR